MHTKAFEAGGGGSVVYSKPIIIGDHAQKTAAAINDSCSFLVCVGNMVHEQQKERGASCVVLGLCEMLKDSGGDTSGDENGDDPLKNALSVLRKQRLATDHAWESFSSTASGESLICDNAWEFHASKKSVAKDVHTLLDFRRSSTVGGSTGIPAKDGPRGLDNFRKKMDGNMNNKCMAWYDAWDWFTSLHEKCLTGISELYEKDDWLQNDAIRGEVASFLIFVRLKEQVGMERALIGGVLAAAKITAEHQLELKLCLARQEFAAVALRVSITGKATEHLASYHRSQCVQQTVAVRRALLHSGLVKASAMITPGHWFHLMTMRINLLRELELEFGNDIRKAAIRELRKFENAE